MENRAQHDKEPDILVVEKSIDLLYSISLKASEIRTVIVV